MSRELKRMIQYLADERTPQRVSSINIANGFKHGRTGCQPYQLKKITSINQLSAALGYRNHSSMYPQNGRYTPEIELLIRKLYDFDQETECWKCFCEFDAQGFQKAYEQLHKEADCVVAEATAANIILVKGPPKAPEPCTVKGLASVELFPTQVGRGRSDIGFDISCGVARICGVPVTIRIGEMTWYCGGSQLDPETRKGRSTPYQANNDVKLRWNGADTFRPAWRVEAENGSIGDVTVPPDFGTLIGLVPGSTVTVTFGVWRPDVEEADGSDTNALVAAFDAISIPLDVDTAAMSIVKKRIIARLASEAIQREGDFITLCKHTVTFVAGSEE